MRAATSSPGTLRPCSMLNRNDVASPPEASDSFLYESPWDMRSVRMRSATGSSAAAGTGLERVGVGGMRASYRVLPRDANCRSGSARGAAPVAPVRAAAAPGVRRLWRPRRPPRVHRFPCARKIADRPLDGFRWGFGHQGTSTYGRLEGHVQSSEHNPPVRI